MTDNTTPTAQPEACTNCRGSGLDPRYNGEYACPDCATTRARPVKICELPHETIEEEDECDRQRLAATPDHALLKQTLTRAVFALKTPSLPDEGVLYRSGWSDAVHSAADAVAKVFDTLDQEGES